MPWHRQTSAEDESAPQESVVQDIAPPSDSLQRHPPRRRWSIWGSCFRLIALILAGLVGWLVGINGYGSTPADKDSPAVTANKSTDDIDELDVLAAVWIFACNDDNPVITHEGVKFRLSLPNDYDVKRLIRSHGELFRPGAGTGQLKAWKEDMLKGRQLAAHVVAIQDREARKKAIEGLTKDDIFRSQFRTDNPFRNKASAKKVKADDDKIPKKDKEPPAAEDKSSSAADDAKSSDLDTPPAKKEKDPPATSDNVVDDMTVARSPLEIVNWGLDRIDRLRKSRAEKREVWERKWQMWSIFGISLMNIVVSVGLALRKK